MGPSEVSLTSPLVVRCHGYGLCNHRTQILISLSEGHITHNWMRLEEISVGLLSAGNRLVCSQLASVFV